MKFLKRVLIGIGLLALVAWIACAALVMFWDDGGPLGELGPQSEGFAIWPGGYTDSFSAVSWEGTPAKPPADAQRESVSLQRGPLDREGSVFPLALRFSTRGGAPIEQVSLRVTSDVDWSEKGEDVVWLAIGTASVRQVDGGWSATVADAYAPASACAYDVQVVYADQKKRGGFAKAMPTAPTFLGRLHDRVAWWPMFRWLPDLR